MKFMSHIRECLPRYRIGAILFALRWVFVLSTSLFGIAYIGYKEHSTISAYVTSDFKDVADAQTELLEQLTLLLPQILDANSEVDLKTELRTTRESARVVVASLGKFRAPTTRIDNSRIEYRDALETLIGVTNRIEREGVHNMALPLHNSLQVAANNSGEFLSAVQDFQGGAWPQVFGAFF